MVIFCEKLGAASFLTEMSTSPLHAAFFSITSQAAGKAVQTGYSRAAVTGDIVHRTRFEEHVFSGMANLPSGVGEGRMVVGGVRGTRAF